MPMNKDDRYQVVAPGNGYAKGFHVATCRLLKEAREAKNACSAPHTFIWDNEARNIDGSKGREVV